ncbi:MAG TPA: iduronate-2-sulfatase, partial [Planctomycetaceae bacterium]|nr:iduronate-2-sulfatase [Planctomycetaceae bacterium]
DALDKSGQANNTIVIFTSDHGYHLGEHDFWAKVSLHDESSQVPLIISVPGKQPAVCNSLVELIDLFPTTAQLCGFNIPKRIQGKDISSLLDDPSLEVREEAFCVAPMRKGFLLRDNNWAFLSYDEDGSKGIELYDVQKDPHHYTNVANDPNMANVVAEYQQKLTRKLRSIRENDLN